MSVETIVRVRCDGCGVIDRMSETPTDAYDVDVPRVEGCCSERGWVVLAEMDAIDSGHPGFHLCPDCSALYKEGKPFPSPTDELEEFIAESKIKVGDKVLVSSPLYWEGTAIGVVEEKRVKGGHSDNIRVRITEGSIPESYCIEPGVAWLPPSEVHPYIAREDCTHEKG